MLAVNAYECTHNKTVGRIWGNACQELQARVIRIG